VQRRTQSGSAQFGPRDFGSYRVPGRPTGYLGRSAYTTQAYVPVFADTDKVVLPLSSAVPSLSAS